MKRYLRVGARAVPVLAMLAAGVATTGPASAFLPHTQPLACGTVIDHGFTLTANVGPCAGDGLIFSASNATLDLGGYKVWSNTTGPAGSPAGEHVGIALKNMTGGVSNSTVKNGEVTGFAAGVRIDGGGRNTVKEINAHDNVGPAGADNNGDGISTWNSDNNTIMNNILTRNGPFSGVAVLTGPYNVYTDAARTTTGNVIKGNEANFNNTQRCNSATCIPRDPNTGANLPPVPRGAITTSGLDAGIRIEGPNATNSQVLSNIANDNGIDGIFVQATCHNAFMPAPTGFVFCQGDVGNKGTMIRDNVTNHNGYGRLLGSGIDLWSMLGNPNVVPSTYSTVKGNVAERNYTDGITLYSTCGATDNPAVCATNNNTVVGNNFNENGRDGIRIANGSAYNLIKYNDAHKNKGMGINAVAGSFNNKIDQNQANANVGLDLNDGNPLIPGCTRATPYPGVNTWSYNIYPAMPAVTTTAGAPCVQ